MSDNRFPVKRFHVYFKRNPTKSDSTRETSSRIYNNVDKSTIARTISLRSSRTIDHRTCDDLITFARLIPCHRDACIYRRVPIKLIHLRETTRAIAIVFAGACVETNEKEMRRERERDGRKERARENAEVSEDIGTSARISARSPG